MISTSLGFKQQALELDSPPSVASGIRAKQRAVSETTPQGSTGRVSASQLRLAVYDDLASVAASWQAFEASADHTFFQTFAWLDAWLRNVGVRHRTMPAVVTGTHPDGTLVFILPLAIQKQSGVRRLSFLGSELCDYNAPLLHADWNERVDASDFALLWRRVLKTLQDDSRFAFDMVTLEKLPERVGKQANPLMALSTGTNPSGAYVTALGTSWDEFYKLKRSSSTRKKERSQLRQLGEFGTVRFVDDLTGDERSRTLDVLFAQKAASFTRMGVRNIFTRPGHRELFTDFVMNPKSGHLVHLSRLEIGDMIAAASIGFTEGGCYYLVLSSYEGQGDMAKLGPGRAHLNELLGRAIAKGFDKFDFTIGDEAYKQDWSDARLTLYDHLSGATPMGHVAIALVTRFMAVKRAIKQNPIFWRLFSRARSYVGTLRARAQAPAGQSQDAAKDE